MSRIPVFNEYSESSQSVNLPAREIVNLPSADFVSFVARGVVGSLVEYRLSPSDSWQQTKTNSPIENLPGTGPVQVRADRPARAQVTLSEFVQTADEQGKEASGSAAGGTLAALTDISSFDLAGQNNSISAAFIDQANAMSAKADLSGGKVPLSQLPDAILGAMIYQGTWNASTNSPAIPAAAAENKGYFYKVSVAGTTSISGINDWGLGDWIVSNGTAWDKIDNSESSTGGLGSLTLVDGDFTSNNLLITSSHLNRIVYLNTTGTKTVTLDDSAALALSASSDAMLLLHKISTTGTVTVVNGGMTLQQTDGRNAGVLLPFDTPIQFIHKTTDTWYQANDVAGLKAVYDTCYTLLVSNGVGTTNGMTGVGLGANNLDSCVTSTAAQTTDAGGAAYATLPRSRYQTAAAAINRVAGFYSVAGLIRIDRRQRMPAMFQAGIADALTAGTLFIGLVSGAAVNFTATEPSAQNNVFGFGADTTDANVQFITRSGTTTTKTDTGIPLAQWQQLRVTIDFADDGLTGFAKIENLQTGAVWPANGAYHVQTANLPTSTQTFYPYIVRSSMANAATAALDIMRLSLGRPS